MNKQQIYIVAGHTFRLIMSEDAPIWDMMENAYAPFKVKEDKQPLFTLTVKEEIPHLAATPVFIDPNPKAEDSKLDVYRTPEGYKFELRASFTDNRIGQLYIDNDFSTADVVLNGNDFERLAGINSVLMLYYMLSTARLSTVLTHASVVVNDGKAYLFLGRSGTGKSTHSRLWQQTIEGTIALNDDHPILRINEQGNVIAYGSPWSGKTPCYRNESATVGGIVRIKRALENKIRRLSPIESYASLLTSCFGMTWDKDLADGKDQTLQSIITTVSCWTLECLPNEEAARVCAQAIRKKEEKCNG